MRNARAQAEKYVRGVIEHRRASGEPDLPGLRRLAREAGVSYVTMWKAVNGLVEQGILASNQGRRYRIRGIPIDAAPSPPPAASGPRWLQAMSRLKADVADGSFTVGDVLPPMKSLCERYGVCDRTMRRAIDRLVQQDFLKHRRRRLVVVSRSVAQDRNAIILEARSDDLPDGRELSRKAEILTVFERLCAQRNIALIVRLYRLRNSRYFRADEGAESGPAHNPSTVLGTCIIDSGLDKAVTRHLVNEALERRRPVALLETVEESGPWAPSRMLRVFRTTWTSRSGEAAGQHLGTLGHRTVAWLSPSEETWAQYREEGLLRGIMSTAGDGTGEVVRFIAPPHGPSLSRAAVDKAIDALVGRYPRPSDPRVDVIRQILATEQARKQVHTLAQQQLRHSGILESLETIAQSTHITAVACANDVVAAMCLQYCRSKHIPVPGRFSILGFDNTVQAKALGLTSYDFNYHGVVTAILNHILMPDALLSRSMKPIEVDGALVVRSSTSLVQRRNAS